MRGLKNNYREGNAVQLFPFKAKLRPELESMFLKAR